RLLFRRSKRDEHRRQHMRSLPQKVRRIRVVDFLHEDVTTDRPPVRATVLRGPMRSSPSASCENALPTAVMTDFRIEPTPRIAGDFGRQICAYELPYLGAEGFVFGAELKIHWCVSACARDAHSFGHPGCERNDPAPFRYV